MRFFAIIILVISSVLASTGVGSAQSDTEKSALLTFVEEKLSAPNREISLNGISGVLSSDVSLESITIADADGIWLTIKSPRLVWSRTALLVGRIEIDSLIAESVDFLRPPLPDTSAPSAEAAPFELPQLPVAVVLKQLQIESVDIGEPVFGQHLKAKLDLAAILDEGALDLNLKAVRLDGVGGQLAVLAQYGLQPRQFKLDFELTEPPDGAVANLLNIEGKPGVELKANGEGPIDDLDIVIGLEVDNQPALVGDIKLRKLAEGLRAGVNLGGSLSRLLPEPHRTFVGETSTLVAEIEFKDSGSVVVDRVKLDSGSLQALIDGAIEPDGFLSRLNADVRLLPDQSGRVTLPTQQTSTTAAKVGLTARYDAASDEGWSARLTVEDIKQSEMSLSLLQVTSSGQVQNLTSPTDRSLTYQLKGALRDLSVTSSPTPFPLGKIVALESEGNWQSGQPLTIERLAIAGQDFSALARGRLEQLGFNGSLDLRVAKLSELARLAGQSLSGALQVMLNGSISPVTGGFDLEIGGQAFDLAMGQSMVDRIFVGQTDLKGKARRNETGLSFSNLNLTNSQIVGTVDGALSSEQSNLSAVLAFLDFKALDPDSTGRVDLRAKISGAKTPWNFDVSATMPKGRLAARSVRDVDLSLNGTTGDDATIGSLSGTGSVGSAGISLAGDLKLQNDEAQISGLQATVGPTSITGDVIRTAEGLLNGALQVESSDIRDFAALALLEARGAVQGKVALQAQNNGEQSGTAELDLTAVSMDEHSIGTAKISADFSELFSKPKINADAQVEDAIISGTPVQSVDASIQNRGEETTYSAIAKLPAFKTRLSSKGVVTQKLDQTEIVIDDLAIRSSLTSAKLRQPTRITLKDGTTTIAETIVSIGKGTLQIAGTAGEQLAINVSATNLPLAIANTLSPGLGISGGLSAKSTISGSSSNPRAVFELSANQLSARQLKNASLSPININASGTYGAQSVTLKHVQVVNSQGLNLQANGRVPLSGGGLKVNLDGRFPLSLAQTQLANRGTKIDGQATLNVLLTGSLAKPQYQGNLAVSGGSVADPLTNLSLRAIAMQASIKGQQVVLDRFSAKLNSGGSITAQGEVGLSGTLPADLRVKLSSARYTDAVTFNTVADGDLAITGQLLQDPTLSGRIDLRKTEITVPESFGAKSKLLEVRHVSPSAEVSQTLNRLDKISPKGTPQSRPSVLRLDLQINAPNKIFVRGRGLDAELGGNVRLRGPVTSIAPLGSFELIRGRLSIVGQRLDLSRASITLEGDLDPLLDFLATTQANDVEASIRLSGKASDLKVTLTSTPELPEDEILSQIIFNRELASLSPTQIARLAAIAAELTGGNSPGLVDGIRRGSGLDDLDVVEDSSGSAAVKAGKYINDKVYVGVQVGKETEATINLDVTDNITARGGVSSNGESKLGVFFEKDY